jgi:DNA-binding MarR family transcriptional regulator
MDQTTETTRDLVLLEQIGIDPDVTQASLATQLGVAVGTVNWHIKRLIAKGYVKVKRAERRKLRYIITPEGITFRARLTVNYIERSMLLYRTTRQQVRQLLGEVRRAGYDSVRIEGDGDIADVCRLTCIEQSIKILPERDSSLVPVLVVLGLVVNLRPVAPESLATKVNV